jgi:hypothetical protein
MFRACDAPEFGPGGVGHAGAPARFLAGGSDAGAQLLLSSFMKSADLTPVVDSFEAFRAQPPPFIKLDEAGSFGPVLNQAAPTGKPLSFSGAGQRIPVDLETAGRSGASELALTGHGLRALSAAGKVVDLRVAYARVRGV